MMRFLFGILFSLIAVGYVSADDKTPDASTRKERNYIREGNKFYEDKRYADAEVSYRKALEENAASQTAMYDLALSLIRQSGSADPNSGNNPLAEAQSLLQNVAQVAQDASLVENAFYNLGNIAFNSQQYDQAINMYKGALRKNPDNDKARENLRLAQLKRQQQQDQQQNQDQNQDQDQQNQQDQQQQDQNKDENKDENKDQNQNQNQQQNKDQQQPPHEQRGGISDANAAKILKAMENEENATRKKVQEMKEKENNSSHRNRGKQW